MHYGIAITKKHRLLIYGGAVKDGIYSRLERNVSLYSELWMLSMTEDWPKFRLIKWLNEHPGGFSKATSLGGELICLFNRNFHSGLIVLDLENLNVLKLEDNEFSPHEFSRTAFGLVNVESTNIIIVGGYNDRINQSTDFGNYLYAINFEKLKEPVLITTSSAFYIGIIMNFPVLFSFIFCFRHRQNIKDAPKVLCEVENGNIKKNESAHSLRNISIPTNSTTTDKGQIADLSCTDEKWIPIGTGGSDNITRTLIGLNAANLCIPLFLRGEPNVDYSIGKDIAKGGFGIVQEGKLLKSCIAKEKNNGDSSCVVKTVYEQTDVSFFQELSIHELFKGNKYFSRLLSYSDTYGQIVLKYYNYGSLFQYVFVSNSHHVPVPYSLEISLHLADRVTNAVHEMHVKGYIHNDLKLGNVLLDSDSEEVLFPVITDFGLCHVLDNATVTSGFKIKNLKAGTPEYCAPEILRSFSQNETISNVKTDVYSIGILLFELFTRTRPWKEFKAEAVILGHFPDISVKKFLDNYDDITRSMAVELLRLVLQCIEYDVTKRLTMEEANKKLKEIKDHGIRVSETKEIVHDSQSSK
jgi:serine/threonine protein kinase